MRSFATGMVALAMIVIAPTAAPAKKCTDDAAVAAARAAASSECDCATATNHGRYVSCVAQVATELVDSGDLPGECKGEVVRCAAKSTCGKPGAVTCCRIDRKGKVKCSIKKTAEKCLPPRDGGACIGASDSCCDACVNSCGGTTTTTTGAPTTTTQAPGTTTTVAPTTTTAAPTTTTIPGSPSSAFVD